MTAEQARYEYWLASFRLTLLARDGGAGEHFHKVALWVEAKSIQLDLAIAESVARRSVAWA